MANAVKPLEMIDGTECKNCFAVFAVDPTDEYIIAIRPLIEPTYGGVFVGFRIRAVAKSSDILNPDVLKEKFPGFKFGRSNNVRASFVGGFPASFDNFKEGLAHDLKNGALVTKLIVSVEDQLGTIPMIQKDQITSFMIRGYVKAMEDIGINVANLVPPPEGADVLQFPTKD